jgi:hypothetical protein
LKIAAAPFTAIFAGLTVASAIRRNSGGEILPQDLASQQIGDEYADRVLK